LGVFTRPVFASEINIENVDTEDLTVGVTFPVIFRVIDAQPHTSYQFKFCGGPENDFSSVETYSPEFNQYLNCVVDPDNDNSISWDNTPFFVTDSLGNALVSGIAYIPFGKKYCPTNFYNYCYSFFVNAVEFGTDIGFTGVPQEIKVFASPLTPTSVPIPSIFVNNPTSTPTKTPTSSSTSSPANNSSPTRIPLPTLTIKVFGTSTPSANSSTKESTTSQDLSDRTSSNIIETGTNPVLENKKSNLPTKKSNFILMIFITIGIILFGPAIIAKIKFKSRCPKK
jgi:hypothetical protein